MKHISLIFFLLLLLAGCGLSLGGQVTEPAPEMTGVAATVVAIQQPRLYASYPSTDGLWRAEVVIYDCVSTGGADENAYEQLRLIQVASGDERNADDQLQSCGGLGAFGFEGLFWSPDSRYFYYTNAREGVPDGCGYWEHPIIRLGVTSLDKEPIGAGPRSPDGSKIATWQGQEVVVWDVNGGEIARLPAIAPNAQTGPIAWAPDSQALVYLQVASWCPVSGKSYLVLVSLAKPEQRLLLESELPTFGVVHWDIAQELSLFDETGKEWCYNLITQELTHSPDQTTDKHRKP